MASPVSRALGQTAPVAWRPVEHGPYRGCRVEWRWRAADGRLLPDGHPDARYLDVVLLGDPAVTDGLVLARTTVPLG